MFSKLFCNIINMKSPYFSNPKNWYKTRMKQHELWAAVAPVGTACAAINILNTMTDSMPKHRFMISLGTVDYGRNRRYELMTVDNAAMVANYAGLDGQGLNQLFGLGANYDALTDKLFGSEWHKVKYNPSAVERVFYCCHVPKEETTILPPSVHEDTGYIGVPNIMNTFTGETCQKNLRASSVLGDDMFVVCPVNGNGVPAISRVWVPFTRLFVSLFDIRGIKSLADEYKTDKTLLDEVEKPDIDFTSEVFKQSAEKRMEELRKHFLRDRV